MARTIMLRHIYLQLVDSVVQSKRNRRMGLVDTIRYVRGYGIFWPSEQTKSTIEKFDRPVGYERETGQIREDRLLSFRLLRFALYYC